jgi:3-oxoacyl-[acyl-carrier protein] reductase
MAKPLENKLALVTGSSRGIGAAIALRLATESASVIVSYAASPARAEAVVNEFKKAGGHAEAVDPDLSNTEGIKTLISSVDKVFVGKFGGRLDIFVNNAGPVDRDPFLDSSDQSYGRHFDLNVGPAVELSKDAGSRPGGDESSAFGEAAPVGGVTLHIATKFAVHGFTSGLSRELGPTGVTVNGIQLGAINTELSPEDGPASEANKKRTSVARYGTVQEIAFAAAFRANPESAFINGENLTVDGGWNA